MANMVPFRYIDFYDVPRTLAVRHRGTLFLLQSAFDDELDDYDSNYSVYVLPESVETSLAEGRWEFLESTAAPCVGRIPVKEVRFDRTKRHQMDPAILDRLISTKLEDGTYKAGTS